MWNTQHPVYENINNVYFFVIDLCSVYQVSMTSVLVSWEGRVSRIDCADQFLVKSWVLNNPNYYQVRRHSIRS